MSDMKEMMLFSHLMQSRAPQHNSNTLPLMIIFALVLIYFYTTLIQGFRTQEVSTPEVRTRAHNHVQHCRYPVLRYPGPITQLGHFENFQGLIY